MCEHVHVCDVVVWLRMCVHISISAYVCFGRSLSSHTVCSSNPTPFLNRLLSPSSHLPLHLLNSFTSPPLQSIQDYKPFKDYDLPTTHFGDFFRTRVQEQKKFLLDVSAFILRSLLVNIYVYIFFRCVKKCCQSYVHENIAHLYRML